MIISGVGDDRGVGLGLCLGLCWCHSNHLLLFVPERHSKNKGDAEEEHADFFHQGGRIGFLWSSLSQKLVAPGTELNTTTLIK